MTSRLQLLIMPIKKMITWVNEHTDCTPGILVATSYATDYDQFPNNSIVEVFEDIDYECTGRSFTQRQAKNYANYIRKLPDSTDLIICACNAGESRSPALCAALCEYFGEDSSWIWDSPHYHPNIHVFDLFVRELGIEISDLRKDHLYLRNRQAFTTAIKNARGVLQNDNS